MAKYHSEDTYIKARKKVNQVKNLIKHFVAFIMVNILIVGLNILTQPNNLWYYYIAIPWIGILIGHFFFVYDIDNMIFDKKWENKRIERAIKRELE